MQIKSNKSCRVRSSSKWLAQIFQKKTFYSSKKTEIIIKRFTKSRIFTIFKKQYLQYVVEQCLKNRHAKFQVDISIFSKHVAQKPYPWTTSFFSNWILSNSRHSTEIKWHFWSWYQTGSEIHFFIRKKQFENFASCGPGLTQPLSLFG